MEIVYNYYNPNNDTFYYKKCLTYSRFDDKERNNYGHMIIQKIEKLEREKKEKKIEKRKKKLYIKYIIKIYIKKLINQLIDLLYRIKSRF